MPVQKWIRAKLRRLVPIVMVFGLMTGGVVVVATPALAVISCGDTLATINGVNVYSNAQNGQSWGFNNCGGTDDYVNGADAGGEWQCVEFVNRYYLTKGWTSAHWFGNGNTLKDNLPSSKFTYTANGSITKIVPGDVVTLDDGGYGHAGVVSSVDPTTNQVTIANQNIGNTVTITVNYNPTAKTLASELSGYSTQGVIHTSDNTASGIGTSGGTATTPSGNLLLNADFGEGTGNWYTYGGTNFTTYASNQLGSQSYYSSFSGVRYASTNTSQAGGGIFNGISLTIPANTTFCATAEVRTSGGGSGAQGTMQIQQLNSNGAVGDAESVNFGPLTSQWQQIETCSVAASGSHVGLRVAFFPTPSTPTLDVDDLDVHQVLAINADFGEGTNYWSPIYGGNFTTYTSNQLGSQSYYSSYSGVAYAEANTASAGGGFYQDVPLSNEAANTTFCVTAQVRTAGGQSGAQGTFSLQQLNSNGSVGDAESVNFGPLTSQWQQIETCSVAASSSHVGLRVAFFPTPNSPTLDVDDVDVS
jgi:hypothetical protein